MPQGLPDAGDADRRVDQGSTGAAIDALVAEVNALRAELQRRHLLDLATGVLVGRHQVTPAAAGSMLEEMASGAAVEVADLAADIVNEASGDPGTAPASTSTSTSPAPVAGRRRVVDEARSRRRVSGAAELGLDLDDVAAMLLEGPLARLGVDALMVWQRAQADCLALKAAVGVGPLAAARWSWIPPQWSTVPHHVTTSGVPQWFPAGISVEGTLPGAEDAPRAVLPLRDGGVAVGVVLLLWSAQQPLDEEIRLQAAGAVEVLARVLGQDQSLKDSAMSRPVLAAVLDLLAQPAVLLHGGGAPGGPFVEYLNAAARRAGSGAPHPVGRPFAQVFPHVHADVLTMVDASRRSGDSQRASRVPPTRPPGGPAPLLNVRVLALGEERSVVLWHQENQDHSFSVLQRAGRLGSLAAFEDDLTSGTAQWAELVPGCLGLPAGTPPFPLHALGALLLPDDRPELEESLQRLTVRLEGVSAVLRLPRPEGGVRHIRLIAEPLLTHGTLTGITGFFQDVSIQHQTEAALAATFDELGSVQAKAAIRHQLALQLQRAIVPDLPSSHDLPGVEVAARYRPAAEEYRVGGDWYDVLRLPNGEVMIAVGDVAGHGIDAATGMVALRNALRGLAFSGEPPGRLMHWLNEVTLHTPGHPTATAVCARYDPELRRLHWTSAGHLPPVLLREGRAELLASSANLLLGAAPDITYQESEATLRSGDMLLLFTDGLIERRHAGIDQSLVTLRRAAERLPEESLDVRADDLLATAVGDTDDDASLVLVRIT
ncbi:SpoIIE family protein phosphatase [Streptacidiphilus jiangxiensis]|uniref:Serine phosphatase RsbU, regulator of sigma subunit n=1 Tax=Streptacidiphilus jiangxiensis TaxID=235985 RepID=A0A1H7H6M2_STRJI|nr:SpoIIE family protein phosphatase [Streptacidiphilus jiangxiensis]SEK45934.1 Serine phosphatase RsbU, regulator of sigma subunit [Streptacidiphilus jiangxiensis]